MKKNLLLAGLMISGFGAVTVAQTKVYTSEELGEVGKVSDNGKYVAITDVDNNIAYLWSSETGEFIDISAPLGDPSTTPSAQCVAGSTAIDVADNGMVVGSVMFRDGRQIPAYYIDDEWYFLELHPGAQSSNGAIAVTPDGSVIAGYQFINDPTSAIGGRFYPVQWKLVDGEYEMHAYVDIELPNHQGFYPYAQSNDGRVVAGTIFAGVASTVPGLIVDGQLKTFDTFETKTEPWMFKGKWYCGTDENGKQIWTDDPDDPRIVLFTEYYINGFHDTGESSLTGSLVNCDSEGHYYGMRTVVTDVDEYGDATLTDGAAIYDINTDEWTYDTSYQWFAAGLNNNFVLTNSSTIIVDGEANSVFDEFDFKTERSLAYLASYSADGKVIGGMTYEVHPGTGEQMYYPIVLVLDRALTGIQSVTGGGQGNPYVIVSSGHIDIVEASSIAVYDINGHLVGSTSTVAVAPGVYIVKADNLTTKVVVK